MRQAECADTAPRGACAPGNLKGFSTRKIVVEVAECEEYHLPIHEAAIHLDKCDTLLRAINEAGDEATAARGFWVRVPGYERERLVHVMRLVGLLEDEIGRIHRIVGAAA